MDLSTLSNDELIKLKKEYTNKVAKFKTMQESKKVQLNSAYGALGNQYFTWFDTRLAEAVTISGQISIKWIEKSLNNYINDILKTKDVDYVIAMDTDSIYINFGPLVEKHFGNLDKIKTVEILDNFIDSKIQKVINDSYEKLAEYLNAYSQKMFMKRECIADNGFWTAKKRYALNVYNLEGVIHKDGYIKVMGLETIKSTTPPAAKDGLSSAIEIILRQNESTLQKHVKRVEDSFKNNNITQISIPKSVSNIIKFVDKRNSNGYIKGTPIHVKGTLAYNDRLDELNLGLKYRKIKEGDKLKYVYLKEPNILDSSVMCFPDEFPKEFGLHDFIDYDKQFEKVFIKPLDSIVKSIGWKLKKVNSLI